MEQRNQEIGTRRDLVLYRLETAKKMLWRISTRTPLFHTTSLKN